MNRVRTGTRVFFGSTLAVAVVLTFLFAIEEFCFAQSLEGRINSTISALIRIINIMIAGFIVWSGFLIAKGEASGFNRLASGIIGFIVANTAYLIVNYFS